MTLIKSMLVAMSTYSVVPVPQFEWNEKNMKYAICFFPLVGALCGLALWGWYSLCVVWGVSAFLFASVAAVLPVMITGGIHLDGYMDTVDAISSHQSRERKLEILKDPNCGAFAVIYCAVYFLLSCGVLYELYSHKAIVAICPVFVLSRALSAICAVNMPNARKKGMLSAYTENAERGIVSVASGLVAVLSAALMLVISFSAGAPIIALALLWTAAYIALAMKQFGGATGDTAGFFLQVCELFCLFGAWIGVIVW